MLERLELENVGPAPEMALDLKRRMNLITGDNGLGKSFLLDVAWWALTRRWPRDLNPRLTSGYPARPTDMSRPAKLRFGLTTDAGNSMRFESMYSVQDQGWTGQPGRPMIPGLVIHAHADGGFSVWDPARNYWTNRGNIDVQDRLPGYAFSPQDVWTGLVVPVEGRPTKVCKGLLDGTSHRLFRIQPVDMKRESSGPGPPQLESCSHNGRRRGFRRAGRAAQPGLKAGPDFLEDSA